jgi:putative hemolysin
MLELIIIAFMVALNAVFAAFELALASVSVHRLEQLVADRRSGARAALRMKGRMEASLAVVQLGITLVGAVAAAVGGAGAVEDISPWLQLKWGFSEGVSDFLALAAIVLPLSAVTIVLGELVPKAFALKNAEWVCRELSPIMQWFAYSVYPAVLSFEWVTKQLLRVVEKRVRRTAPDSAQTLGMNELAAQARAMRVGRVISPQQERVIVGAGRLSHMTIVDIMVPATEIKMLNADDRLIDHLITVHLEAHTRFLVTEKPGDPQGIIGYANVKDLFFLAKTHPDNPNVREIIRPLPTFAPNRPIGEAFSRMMAEHLHLALVCDAKGAVLGMITLEDILEEVVGDIQDEFDRLPRVCRPAGRQWLVGGGLPLIRLREVMALPRLGEGMPGEITLNDWVARHDDSTRSAGQTIDVDGVRVLVRKVRRQRIMEALVWALPRPAT